MPLDDQGTDCPLDGVRVLELGQVISAPYAGLLLADLGAEVIKVEQPPFGDSARNPGVTGMGEDSATFVTLNRNKRSICLDLKDPTDYEVFRELVAGADVVLTNTLPDAARRLRVDHEALSSINPRVITCYIQGFPSRDPRSDEPSFDLTHQALAGYMLMEGSPGDPPLRVCIPIADLAGAMFAAYGVLAALFSRERTGRGERIEVPMYDSLLSLLTYTATLYLNTGKPPRRMGSAHEYAAPWQSVSAADGSLVVAVRSDKFWQRLCTAIDREEWIEDTRFATNAQRLANREALDAALAGVFGTRKVADWIAVLRASQVPAAPVRTVGQALDELAAQQDDLIASLDHERLGDVKVLRNPVRFAGMTTARLIAEPHFDADGAKLREQPWAARAERATGRES